MLTCNLTRSVVVSLPAFCIPGCALDAVVGPCLQVGESYAAVSGVEIKAGVGALLDNGERVEDGILNLRPVRDDGVVGGGGGVKQRCSYHCRRGQTRTY